MNCVLVRLSRRLFFLVAIFLLIGCADSRASVVVHFVNPDGKETPKIKAELATTPREQRLGLMCRKNLGTDEGMLFVFAQEAPRSFWMKHTYLELDIIFIDSRFRVVSIAERAVPQILTLRRSTCPAKYVLEVLGRSAATWGVSAGSTLVVHGSIPGAK